MTGQDQNINGVLPRLAVTLAVFIRSHSANLSFRGRCMPPNPIQIQKIVPLQNCSQQGLCD